MAPRKVQITIEADEVPIDQLAESDARLVAMADTMTNTAYAPYSGFRVGAAVLLENGAIVTGSNQENVAYPSGLCAERVALFAAGAQQPGVAVHTIAIVAHTDRFAIISPLTPCGGCRQVMMEFRHRQSTPIRLLLAGGGKVWVLNDASLLLPFAFEAEGLKSGPYQGK